MEIGLLQIWDKRGKGVEVKDNIGSKSSSSWFSVLKGIVGANLSGTDLMALAAKKNSENGFSADGTPRRIIALQFNPSEISFTAYGGNGGKIANLAEPPKADKEDSAHLAETEKKEAARVEMTIPFIIDRTNNSDAFMSSTNQLSVSVSTVANLLKSRDSSKYTVQPYVEALVATIKNSRLRDIDFIWGDMYYRGIVNKVNASYTMFSTSGRPIRATVSVTLVLTDREKSAAWWDLVYRRTVGNYASASYAKASQTISRF